MKMMTAAVVMALAAAMPPPSTMQGESGYAPLRCVGQSREVWFRSNAGTYTKVDETKAGGWFSISADVDYYRPDGSFVFRKGNYDYVCNKPGPVSPEQQR